MAPLLEAQGISKVFGNLSAIHNVDLSIQAGEIVGLAGRSGAGKSVLTRILAGLQAPDAGTLWFDEQRLRWPFRAQEFGIGVVHQEPELADQLNVTSNIFLGHELGWSFFHGRVNIPNQQKMDERAAELLAKLGLQLPNLAERAMNLTSEQRQLVSIAQVMARPAKLRIIDDPNDLLSSPYQDKLLDLIREWQRDNIGMLFSSNNLDHLFAVADRLIVLRQGRVAANLRSDETTREEVVAALVGNPERRQLTPVIWALDSYFRARRQAEALHHNQALLEQDLAMQDSLNRELFAQLGDQVKALDAANIALQAAQRRLLTEREEERKRLARELHDQMIQDLLSLNYQLEEIESKVTAPSGLFDDLNDVRTDIRGLVEELRRICGNLRPPTIDSLGLPAALKSHMQDWSERTGIEATLEVAEDLGRLPEDIELSIFRMIQEGLSNVWRHANASEVRVALTQRSPRMLVVTIADNGVGLPDAFDLAAVGQAGHYGLLGISERVALMGGRLSFRNQTDSGLIIQAEIPHPRTTPY